MTALELHTAEFGYGPARAARLESDRALTRALPASFLFVTAMLLALSVAQRFTSTSPIVVELGPIVEHTISPPGVIELPPSLPVFRPTSAGAAANHVPMPVPETAAPVLEPVAGRSTTNDPGVPGSGPAAGEEGCRCGVTAPDPEPGVFVPTDHLPERLLFVAPEYSDMARDAGVEGTVMLWALVDLDGSVKEVRVLRSVPLLDAAASNAVRRWRFTPAMTNGHPVRVWVAVPVKFTLH